MLGAFLVPLIFGGIISKLIYMQKIKYIPNRISNNLYNAGIATFTVYCILRGILEIYGTTNKLINLYIVAGIFCLIASWLSKNINK
jgi:branched-subunit amino acid transport protein